MSRYPTQAEMRVGWEKQGRGLDFDLAVLVMGWKIAWIPPAYDGHFGAEPYWKGPGTSNHNGGIWSKWRPSRDLNLCAQAEARVVELGLGEDYAAELLELAGQDRLLEYTSERLYVSASLDLKVLAVIATAPAEVRCRAMLAAVRGTP